jgi:hypothetical protein
MDLLKLKAEATIQEGLRDAASAGEEAAREEFFGLTGLYPTELDKADLVSTYCHDGKLTYEGNGKTYGGYTSRYNYKDLNARYSTVGDYESLIHLNRTKESALTWQFYV